MAPLLHRAAIMNHWLLLRHAPETTAVLWIKTAVRILVVLWNLICLQWRWRTPCASRGVAVGPTLAWSSEFWLTCMIVSLWRTSEQFYEQLPQLTGLIMAALWNRAGHYIFALWFSSIFFLLSFFLA